MEKYHHGNLKETLVSLARQKLEQHRGQSDFSGLSLRALAREAQVSPTAVYHHFASKEALLEAVALESFDELGRRWEGHSPQEMGVIYLDFFQEHPALLDLLFGPALGNSPALQEAQNQGYQQLERALKAQMGSPEATKESLLIWAFIHGLAHLYRMGALGPQDTECAGIPDLWLQSHREILTALGPLLDRALGKGQE